MTDHTNMQALNLIKLSKAAVSSPENLFSFFLLDCISYNLVVFYNKDYNPKKNLVTDLLIPIDFYNYTKTLNIIKKKIIYVSKKKFFLKINHFDNYLEGM